MTEKQVCFVDALLSRRPSLDRVVDHLFIGNEDARRADVLEANAITHVLCIQMEWERKAYPADLAKLPEHVIEQWFQFVDGPDHGSHSLEEIAPHCIEFIDRAILGGGTVLVHCAMGVSRSAAVVMVWLMHKFGWSADDAYQKLVEARPRVRPHLAFWKQLREVIPQMIAEMKKDRDETDVYACAHKEQQ